MSVQQQSVKLPKRRKQKMEKIEQYVELTWGVGFSYKGDLRLLPAAMESIKDNVNPMLEEGSRKAMENGWVQQPNPVEEEAILFEEDVLADNESVRSPKKEVPVIRGYA